MTKPTSVTVTAAEGRIVPIAPSDATAPGGRLLMVNPGDVVELPNSSYVRRRIAAGDLVVVAPSSSSSAPRKPATKPQEEG